MYKLMQFHVYDRRYFYFITNKSYVLEDVTRLTLKLDVYTTYLFNHSVQMSYVERCHTDRWINGKINKNNLVDEGLPTYDYFVTKYVKNAYNLIDNGTNIYITSTPLNKVGTGGGNNDNDDNPTMTPVKTKCTASNGDIYTYPTTGTITAGTPSYPSGGNSTGGSAHYGIDIANSEGTPIYAPYTGLVAKIQSGTTGYGNYVIINVDDQGNGETYHLFGHLSKFSDIEVGQRVTKSTVIGYMGSTGNSTGNHLHWEISPDGTFNTSNYITPDSDWKSKYLSEVK